MLRLQLARTWLTRLRSSVPSRGLSSMAAEPVVLATVEGGIAQLTLNRPRALNALNSEMVTRAYQHYREWAAEGSGVRAIILQGAGHKAFCAGGDVKHVALQVAAGQLDAAMSFFKREYLLDAAIACLRLPHIALLDGITMGGGAGVSMHGAFRVATERTVFAMPECAIGLFPDVGMMAVLPHLPSHVGAYLALTGARLTGAQVKEAGLATHFIHSSLLHAIPTALQAAGAAAADLSHVHSLLAGLEAQSLQQQGPPTDRSLLRLLPVIDSCFRHGTVGEVVAALQAEAAERPWCEEALQQLQRGSPLSAAVTLAYYHRSKAAAWGALAALQQDCVLCGHFMAGGGDFYEGVRARLIDKDDAPTWKHSSHAQVPGELVARFFTPRRSNDVLALQELLAAPEPAAAVVSRL